MHDVSTEQIEIYPLTRLNQMPQVVELQKAYWGQGAGAFISAHMLFSIVSNGGHVLAAMHSETLAGVVIGLLGANPRDDTLPTQGNLHVYSKRMVVNPAYRNLGLGSRLKFAQRDFALGQGIDRVVWTFDPLLSMNAHLNIRKLGTVSRAFLTDYYGTDNTGGLSPLGSSDRLYVEWELTHERVTSRINQAYSPKCFDDYIAGGAVVMNETTVNADGLTVPSGQIQDVSAAETVLVEIPTNYYDVINTSRDAATAWREHNRVTLRALIGWGYTVTDFVRAALDGRNRVFYVLQHNL